jgi:hypothetical protein
MASDLKNPKDPTINLKYSNISISFPEAWPGGVAQSTSHPPQKQKTRVRTPPGFKVFLGFINAVFKQTTRCLCFEKSSLENADILQDWSLTSGKGGQPLGAKVAIYIAKKTTFPN